MAVNEGIVWQHKETDLLLTFYFGLGFFFLPWTQI